MELIYQKDSYKRNLLTKVTVVDESRNALQLNSTIFYPGGGGQPADHGWIEFENHTAVILNIKRDGPDIWYIVDGKLPEKNMEVELKIDWERRYQLMRTHTAMHILCGVIWRDFQAQVTGGNMEPLTGRMDFEFEHMSRDLVDEIETKINTEVQKARDIEVNIMPRAVADKIPDLIRTKVNLLPSHLKEIRTVEIKGLDLQADGGTHVKNTLEVGDIKITDYKSKGKINKRLKVQLK
jgi:misacylated tRNA(Ala) deacylase